MTTTTNKQGSPSGGNNLTKRIKKHDRYREQFNPMKGLTIARAINYLEQYVRGEFADIMWLMYFVEQADADLYALIMRRTSAIGSLDWSIKTVDYKNLPAEMQKLAKEQEVHLRKVYDRITNLHQAIKALEMAAFHGYTVIQKQKRNEITGEAVAATIAPTYLEIVQPWRILREGLSGPFYFNESGQPRTTHMLSENDRLEPLRDALVIREVHRPLVRIALLKFIRSNLSEKDWDAFVEIYGIPAAIVIGPQDIPAGKEDEYRDAATTVAEGGSGYLPFGSLVDRPTAERGVAPFKDRLDHLTEKLILAGTGGMLTMLVESGSGTLAGNAHQETFTQIAESEAMEITDVLQKHIDLPELSLAFPNQPCLAYFELAAPDKVDITAVIDHQAKLTAAGLTIEPAQLAELTGYKIVASSIRPQPQYGAPQQPPMFNRELNNRMDALKGAFVEAIRSATAQDLKPLTDSIESMLGIEDDAEFVNALRDFHKKLPDLISNENNLAVVLEHAMNAAFANGIEGNTP